MDKFDANTRSRIMSKIKGKNTSIEVAIRKGLWRQGMRGYRLHAAKVLGNPDVVFSKKKVAIFIDGDFWHGWELKKGRTFPPYWESKIKRNMVRDKKYTRLLKENGWVVVRVWEHDVIKDIDKTLGKIKGFLS